MPQNFLPAVIVIWRKQRLVEGLGAASCRVLLPRLLASIVALVQLVNAHYTVYRRLFGRHRRGKKESAEKAVEQRAANQHNMVSGSRLDLLWLYS
jgi:hypothetical protein